MEIEIVTFGKIAGFLKTQQLMVNDIEDTDGLKAYLEHSFPALANTKYKLAVNKSLIQDNIKLKRNDSVAIMPPFSGG